MEKIDIIMWNVEKYNCKLFNNSMEKINIIIWNIWTYRNQIVFRKVKSNPFPIIEKFTLIFQNLIEYLIDPYLQNK